MNEQTEGPKPAKVVTLSTGEVLQIFAGKAKDMMKAQKESEGKTERLLPILISHLTLLDSRKLVLEDIEELPMKVFSEISTHFNEVNF